MDWKQNTDENKKVVTDANSQEIGVKQIGVAVKTFSIMNSSTLAYRAFSHLIPRLLKTELCIVFLLGLTNTLTK